MTRITLPLLAALVALPAVSHAREVPFAASVALQTGFDGAFHAASGDLDGDGDLDFVASAIIGGSIKVFLNDGTGAFTISTAATLNGAARFVLYDMDRDGDLDIVAAADGADTYSWLANDGAAGTWTSSPIGGGAGAFDLRVVDIDGDGDGDVVGVNKDAGSAVWFANQDGVGGSWSSASTISSSVSGTRDVAAADMDGDGDIDVLVSSWQSDDVTLFSNDGAGASWTSTVIDPNSNGAECLVPIDLDRDGDLDIVHCQQLGDQLVWYANDGAWTKTVIAAANGIALATPVDLDHDGDIDFVGSLNGASDVIWYENLDGFGGSFTTRTVDANLSLSNGHAVGDFDSDGDADIVGVGYGADLIRYYENDLLHGTSFEWTRTNTSVGYGDPRHTHAADLDGDGDLDFVGGGNGGVIVGINDGTGAFTPETVDAANRFWAVGSGDLDGDGDLDLIASSQSVNPNFIAWYPNDGGVWGPSTTIATGTSTPRDIEVRDLDQDGDLDAVLTHGSNLTVFLNDGGAASFSSFDVDSSITGSRSVQVIDFDQDGDLDLVVTAETDDVVSWYENDGTTVTPGSWTRHVISNTNGAISGFAIDIDFDGDLDVVSSSVDDVEVHTNSGDNLTFTTTTVDTGLQSGNHIDAADFDRDGDIDLLVSANDSVIFYEDQGGTWVAMTAGTGTNILHGAIGDFDLDGDLDGLYPHLSGGDIWRLHRNDWTESQLASTDLAPGSIGDNEQIAIQSLLLSHWGRTGDPDLELSELTATFTGSAGAPMVQADIESVIAAVDVYEDDGDGVFSATTDTLLATVSSLPSDSDGAVPLALSTPATVAVGSDTTLWLVIESSSSAVGGAVTSMQIAASSDPLIEDAVYGVAALVEVVTDTTSLVLQQAPVADAGGPYTGDEGLAITMDGSGSSDADDAIASYAWDCDGDGTYEASGIAATCTFDDDGTFTVGLQVTDAAGNTGTDTATVTTSNVAPTLSISGPSTADEGDVGTFTATVSDVSGDTVTVSWSATSPTGVTIAVGFGTSVLILAPGENGNWTVIATATDGDGGSTTVSQTVAVSNVAPEVTQTGTYTGDEGDTLSWSASATDLGADTVTLGWTLTDPSGATADTGTGSSFSASVTDEGTWVITTTADDGDGGTDSVSNNVIVSNVAPIITSTASSAAPEGVAWTYTPSVTDPGADTLAFSTTGAPAGMTVDSSTGALAWTPTYSDVGAVTFTLEVSDGDGGTDSESITLNVSFTDSEPDGMADTWETANSLDPTVDDSALDPDLDGLTNLEEFTLGQDPQSYDGPDAPTLTSPIAGAEVGSATPILTWANASDPQGDVLTYDVELYEDSSLAVLIDSATGLAEGAGSTEWTPSNTVAENALGYWRVRASDAAVDGAWSNLESFFVNAVDEAPSVPVAASPLTGDSVATLSPTLTWTASTDVDGDALTYDVRIWDATQTVVVVQELGVSGLSWTATANLSEDTAYAWDVQAVDDDALASGFSTAEEFFVDANNTAPSDVAWVNPTDGAQLTEVAPVLEVTASSDPEGDALTYVFELDVVNTYDSSELLSFGAGDVTWDLAADSLSLTENMDWFARARVEDDRGGASAWTEITFFVRGDNDGPAAPVLVAPEDGFTLTEGEATPSLVLGHAVDPEGDDVTYGLRLARDEALTDIVDEVSDLAAGAGSEGTADQTSWQPSGELTAGVYYWTGTATDDGGASTDAEEVWSFEVEEQAGDDDDSAGDDDDATGDDDDATGDDDDATGDDDDSAGDDDATGCDCESSVAPGGASAWALLLLGALVVRRRRG